MVAFGMRNVLGMSPPDLGFVVVDMKTPEGLGL